MMNYSLVKSTRESFDVPFRIYIPPGRSDFVVQIPHLYRDKTFFFSYFVLYADCYSNQAAEMEIDPDDELDEVLHFPISLKCNFPSNSGLYPGTFSPTNEVKTTPDLATTFGNFFEANKNEGLVSLGAFFDWVDIRFYDAPRGTTLKDWVENVMAVIYYGEPFDEDKHANKLPPSAAKIEGVNSYLFPTVLGEETMDNLGFRFWLAPITRVAFSTNGHLKNMGFDTHQIGPRIGKQFVWENKGTSGYKNVESENLINYRLTHLASSFHATLSVTNVNFVTRNRQVEITRGESLDVNNFEAPVQKILKLMETRDNVRVGLSFDRRAKTFSFSFPSDPNFADLRLAVEPDFAQKLGFRMVTEISRVNPTGEPVRNISDLKDARDKATALAYDAGIVIVTDNNSQSATTLGISQRAVAKLFATFDGQLKLPTSDVCNFPSTLTLSDRFANSSELIPATFRLWRFLDEGIPEPLVWKVGAYVQGNLKGI